MKFNPCRGGDNCTQGGTHCQGCGRSHEEIAKTREAIDAVAQAILKLGYDNAEEFVAFVAAKAVGRARMLKQQTAIA